MSGYRSDYESLQHAANRVGVHYTTLYRWAKAGWLPAFTLRPRGRLMVRRADVDAMLTPSGAINYRSFY